MSGKKRKKHLSNARQCRRFLTTIANEMYTGKLDKDQGGKIAYVVSIILRSLELNELEERVRALESQPNTQRNGKHEHTISTN
jgi:hypothetical protein